MENEMQQQLLLWKAALSGELAGLETQLEQIRAALAEKREKISAIDKLIGSKKDQGGGSAPVAQIQDIVDDSEDRDFTPVKTYWRPILQTLVETGGRGRREKVIELVGKKMKDIFTPADFKKLPPSSYIRWENRVAWQASNMRRDGYIKKDSPRGIWEITDAGRKWLDDNI
jgi:hypothetical protein